MGRSSGNLFGGRRGGYGPRGFGGWGGPRFGYGGGFGGPYGYHPGMGPGFGGYGGYLMGGGYGFPYGGGYGRRW